MSLQELHTTLSQRRRPEDVAEMLLPLLEHQLDRGQLAILQRAVNHSLRRSFWQHTAMSQVFRAPVGAEKQVRKAAELFKTEINEALRYAASSEVEAVLCQLSPLISKEPGQNDYLNHRLDRTGRKAAGLDISKRQYNKLFRSLRHIEHKLQKMQAEAYKAEMEQLAKHGLAHQISYEEFARDEATAAFIAYYTARCNLRSEFTISGQQRPFDEVAEMLLQRCYEPARKGLAQWLTPVPPVPKATTNWWALAQVYPAPGVLAQLSAARQGELLGQWTTILHSLATYLKQVWEVNSFARHTMVVKRGDDSSTWNAAAGAWNKARDNWINLLYALGMEFVLEAMCFGKALRLMAADVVAWHHSAGQGLDPNTQVWNALPLPWEVLINEATCTAADITTACQRAGLDPYKSGWLAPRPHGVVAFRPTPELVHGVSVANPYLATILKRHRYFSGKPM
ncbi:hypothetical protein [Hymenobacter canadensis]|uniref:Uncharacterized protein n=1 Tax=Hymenobacter canadensis TaxID=2999067 RepID=A0ABY7LIG7_9BACT|nr:hypothetical protein [Hymenobacter canadensis]WBA40248.1 hypothetical protein O3303_10440 [Hymenobacter canadensis]